LRLLINHVTSHTTTKSFPQVNGLSRTHILDLQVLCIIQTAPQSIQMATSSCFSFIWLWGAGGSGLRQFSRVFPGQKKRELVVQAHWLIPIIPVT
jgi:hypothetical protein